MLKGKDNARFIRVLADWSSDGDFMIIYADTHTGVQYVFARPGGDAGGMTVLVDESGRPLINEEYKREKE